MILGQAFVPTHFTRGQNPLVVIRARTVSEAERAAEALSAVSFLFAGERYLKLGAEWICMS